MNDIFSNYIDTYETRVTIDKDNKLYEFLDIGNNFNPTIKLSDYVVIDYNIQDIKHLNGYSKEYFKNLPNDGGDPLIRSYKSDADVKYNGKYYGIVYDDFEVYYKLVFEPYDELPCEKLSDIINLKEISDNTGLSIKDLEKVYVVFTHELHS